VAKLELLSQTRYLELNSRNDSYHGQISEASLAKKQLQSHTFWLCGELESLKMGILGK
jgi:hypothetical protein